MSQSLRFADSASRDDALTFAGRTVMMGGDALRLQAVDGVLTMTTAALAPVGLLDATPTILGLRALAVDPELICDLVLPPDSLMPDPASDTAILLPETAISAAWAGVAPPRSSWEEVDSLAAEALARRAQWGMSAVARGVPTNPGEDVVRAVRAQVWGVLDDELGGLPLGVAFAASTLGFLGDPAQAGERARVLSSGRWTRVSLQRGHVLVRGPVVSGLTAVRATGRTS